MMKAKVFCKNLVTIFVIVILLDESLALERIPSKEAQEAYNRSQKPLGKYEPAREVRPRQQANEVGSGSPVSTDTSVVSSGRVNSGFNKQESTTAKPSSDFYRIKIPNLQLPGGPSTNKPLREVHFHKEYEIPNLQLPAEPSTENPPSSIHFHKEYEIPNLMLPKLEPQLEAQFGSFVEASRQPSGQQFTEFEIPNLKLPTGPASDDPQRGANFEQEYEIANLGLPAGPNADAGTTTTPSPVHYHQTYEIPDLEPPPLGASGQRKPPTVYLAPDTPLPVQRIPTTRYTPEREPPRAIPFSEYTPRETLSGRKVAATTYRPPTPSDLFAPPQYAPFPVENGRPPTPSPLFVLPPSEARQVSDYASPVAPVQQIRHVITYILPPTYVQGSGQSPEHEQLVSDIETSIKDLLQARSLCRTCSGSKVEFSQPSGPGYYQKVYTTQLIK